MIFIYFFSPFLFFFVFFGGDGELNSELGWIYLFSHFTKKKIKNQKRLISLFFPARGEGGKGLVERGVCMYGYATG